MLGSRLQLSAVAVCLVATVARASVAGSAFKVDTDDDTFEASLYDMDYPAARNDPLMSFIGELTAATKPATTDVLKVIFESTGQPLPTVDDFKHADLGESAGSKGTATQMDGLRSLLDRVSSARTDHWGSVDALESLVGRSIPDNSLLKSSAKSLALVKPKNSAAAAKGIRKGPAAALGPSDTELWQHAMQKAHRSTTNLDDSKDFNANVLLQFPSTVLPAEESAEASLQHLSQEEVDLKRKAHEDMDIAMVTENEEDLQRGLKEVHRLETVDEEVKTAKRHARDLEDEKEGHAPARDFLTERTNLEQQVQDQMVREHIARLRLQLKHKKEDAFAAKMDAAKLLRKYDAQTQKGTIALSDVHQADAKADLAVDRSKRAQESLDAALGEARDRNWNAFARMPAQDSLPGGQPEVHQDESPAHSQVDEPSRKDALSSKAADDAHQTESLSKVQAEKLAMQSTKTAERTIRNSLLSDTGFDRAATAAKIALAYDNTADKMKDHKMQQAKQNLEKAKAMADRAMVEAIQTGTSSAYINLRQQIAERRHAEEMVNDIRKRRKMKSRLASVSVVGKDPSVMLSARMSKDSDAKFYKTVKDAENAYENAEFDASDKEIKDADSLVVGEEKALKQSNEDRMRLVKMRTTSAAKNMEQVQSDAKAAIEAEHEATRDYQKARRHAWNAITAKEAAHTSVEDAQDELRTAEEQLADQEGTMQEAKDRYTRLAKEAEDARQNSVAANAVAKSSSLDLKRREETLNKLRHETAQSVRSELHRLKLEVETLEKTGHKKLAAAAIQRSKVNDERHFLKDEEKREVDARIDLVRKDSTQTLTERMNELVKGESDKLKQEVDVTPEGGKPDFQGHSDDLDQKLAQLSSQAEMDVRAKIEKIQPQTSESPQGAAIKRREADKERETDSELDKMFAQTAKFRAVNDQREKKRRDAEFVVQHATKVERSLFRKQTLADKPLAAAEEELQQIIRTEDKVKEQLSNQTYAGQALKKNLEQKFTNAKRALKMASDAMDSASTDAELKRGRAKMKAAKQMMKNAEALKLKHEREKLDKKMKKVDEAARLKRSAVQEAADAAADALHSLQQKDIEHAKTKILEAQIRHDQWMLKNMQEKVQETRDTAEHEKHKYDDIARRTERAQWAVTKAKRLARGEKKQVTKFKEAADGARRHYNTLVKVAHLADEHYKEAGEHTKELKKEAEHEEHRLKEARQDLRDKEKAEQEAILSTDAPARPDMAQ